MRFVVGRTEAGDRLDVVVARRTDLSRSAVGRRIADGLVLVDGMRAPKSHECAEGEPIEILDPVDVDVAPPPLPPVRYRDDDVAVIAKPAGLVVHPGAAHHRDTLVDALRAHGFPAVGSDPSRPGIVHRLDRDTSGLLLVGCSEAGYAGLVEQLASRSVERTYLALVAGHPPQRARVDGPIGRSPTDRTRFAIIPGGKPAVTTWERLETIDSPRAALLACRLETGRTHQIRVHASTAGHPVAGDARYGGGPLGRSLGLDRMFLHAARLGFRHPVTGEPMAFAEPLPADLAAVLDRLGVPPGDLVERL